MFGGTAGVVALVLGILVVLLIAGTALVLQARRGRRRPAEARRTSWPRPDRRDEQGQDGDGPTTRLPRSGGPADPGPAPIDSAAAQRDPDTVVTRRDDPPGSLFEPSTPDDPPPRR
jgi:hypothetical protein